METNDFLDLMHNLYKNLNPLRNVDLEDEFHEFVQRIEEFRE